MAATVATLTAEIARRNSLLAVELGALAAPEASVELGALAAPEASVAPGALAVLEASAVLGVLAALGASAVLEVSVAPVALVVLAVTARQHCRRAVAANGSTTRSIVAAHPIAIEQPQIDLGDRRAVIRWPTVSRMHDSRLDGKVGM
jgi:hypothetical protein